VCCTPSEQQVCVSYMLAPGAVLGVPCAVALRLLCLMQCTLCLCSQPPGNATPNLTMFGPRCSRPGLLDLGSPSASVVYVWR
jgi:hypothetical protein